MDVGFPNAISLKIRNSIKKKLVINHFKSYNLLRTLLENRKYQHFPLYICNSNFQYRSNYKDKYISIITIVFRFKNNIDIDREMSYISIIQGYKITLFNFTAKLEIKFP